MIKRFLFTVLLAQCIFLVGANLLVVHSNDKLPSLPTTIAQPGFNETDSQALSLILKPASSRKKSESHRPEAFVEFEEENKSGNHKQHGKRGNHLSTVINTITPPNFHQAKECLLLVTHSIFSVSTKRQLLFQVFRI